MAEARPEPSRIRRLIPPLLLDAPDFRRLWTGQTISVLGDQVTQIGLPLVAVLVLGADPAQMGLLTAAGLLPHLLFSLPAGIGLDRVRRRRRLMIAADLGRAALIVSIPVAYVLGVLSMAQLYVVGFLSGSLAVVFDVAWNTVFVSVVARDRYVESMALLNGSRSHRVRRRADHRWRRWSRCSAPRSRCSRTACRTWARSCSCAGSGPRNRRSSRNRWAMREQVTVGLTFLFRDAIMRPTLLSVAWVNLFTFAFGALFILYATTDLGISPGVLGLSLGFGAIGGLIGAVVASRIGRRIGLGPAYALGLLLFPVSLVLIPHRRRRTCRCP